MKIRVPASIDLSNKKNYSDIPENISCELQSTGSGWYLLQVFENEMFMGNRLGYVSQPFSGDGYVEIVYATRGKGPGFICVYLYDSLCNNNYLALCSANVFRDDLLGSAVRLGESLSGMLGIKMVQHHTGADC